MDFPSSKDGYKLDFDHIFKELNIPHHSAGAKTEYILTNNTGSKIEYQNKKIIKNLVPNVEGMGARDAITLMENAGYKVIVKGRGRVANQSVAAGTKAQKGNQITLEMSQL